MYLGSCAVQEPNRPLKVPDLDEPSLQTYPGPGARPLCQRRPRSHLASRRHVGDKNKNSSEVRR